YPMLRGPGVYKGEVSPGIQSRSLVSHTQEGGLDRSSRQRTDATEAVRQLFMGQSGRGGHVLQKGGSPGKDDTFSVTTGRVPSDTEAKAVQDLLDENIGFDAKGNPNTTIVFTDNGYRILNLGGVPNRVFNRKLTGMRDDLENITGEMEGIGAKRSGIYEEYDWEGGTATKQMLETVDNPMYPGTAAKANSPETRRLAGEMADLYDQLREVGGMDNAALTQVLRAWQEDGLPAVRRMVQQGLAPAAVLSVLGMYGGSAEQSEQGL
ncbi:MAG: hypothetical protein DRI46_12295, partial [Chloroflexi bacterium]